MIFLMSLIFLKSRAKKKHVGTAMIVTIKNFNIGSMPISLSKKDRGMITIGWIINTAYALLDNFLKKMFW